MSGSRCTSPSFLKAGRQQHLRLPPLRALFHEALLARSRPQSWRCRDAAVDESQGLIHQGPACVRDVCSNWIGFTESQRVAARCNLPASLHFCRCWLPRSSSLSLAAHVGNEGPGLVLCCKPAGTSTQASKTAAKSSRLRAILVIGESFKYVIIDSNKPLPNWPIIAA